MDRLVQELLEAGEVTPLAIDWAYEHASQRPCSLAQALLELDLVDEQGLVRALAATLGMPAAQPSDVREIEPGLASRLPPRLELAPALCPIRLEDDELTLLASEALGDEWLAEVRSAGLRPVPLAAPEHYLALARSAVYWTPPAARTGSLEQRLARRRGAPDVGLVAAQLAEAQTSAAAAALVLDYASYWVEYVALLVCHQDRLRIVALRGAGRAPTGRLPLPEPGCTVAAAVRYGGYFLGPLAGGEADLRFYQGLGRSLGCWAFVAPVPVTDA